jgi:hypothetical protein
MSTTLPIPLSPRQHLLSKTWKSYGGKCLIRVSRWTKPASMFPTAQGCPAHRQGFVAQMLREPCCHGCQSTWLVLPALSCLFQSSKISNRAIPVPKLDYCTLVTWGWQVLASFIFVGKLPLVFHYNIQVCPCCASETFKLPIIAGWSNESLYRLRPNSQCTEVTQICLIFTYLYIYYITHEPVACKFMLFPLERVLRSQTGWRCWFVPTME